MPLHLIAACIAYRSYVPNCMPLLRSGLKFVETPEQQNHLAPSHLPPTPVPAYQVARVSNASRTRLNSPPLVDVTQFVSIWVNLHQFASMCSNVHQLVPICANFRKTNASICISLRQFASNCIELHQVASSCTPSQTTPFRPHRSLSQYYSGWPGFHMVPLHLYEGHAVPELPLVPPPPRRHRDYILF